MDYRKIGSFLALIGVLLVLLLVIPSSPAPADAQTGPTPVTGWAWSSNVGWIKFDHGQTGEVMMDSSGNLSGYAWSSNIGWIDFAPAGPYPVNESPHGVRLNMTTGEVAGWARAVSQIGKTDGWDGWIRFDHGQANPVRVNLTSGQADGFAWGSTVLGWIDMSPAFSTPIPPCDPATQNCDPGCDPADPDCGNTCDPATDVCFPCDSCGGGDGFDLTIRVIGPGQVEDASGTVVCSSTTGNITTCNLSNIDSISLTAIPDPVQSDDTFDWGGACSGVADDTNPCNINSEPNDDAIVTFNTSGGEITDPFDVEVCTNVLGNPVICTLRIDCSIGGTNQTGCENLPGSLVFSNPIRLENNIGTNININWSASPAVITNGQAQITIVFCPDQTTSSCSSSPQLSGNAFIRAKLNSRGNETTLNVDVIGSSVENPTVTDTEQVRVIYEDGGGTQKSTGQ